MKVAFVSDLHVDFAQPRIDWTRTQADVLAIAGDTANTVGDAVKHISKAAGHFSSVVVVDGNHEGYSNAPQNRTVEQTIDRLRALVPSNVTVLGHHQPAVEIGGVHFVGCNGWYSCDIVGDPIANRERWREEMNDCRWVGFDKIDQPMPWDRAAMDATLMRGTIEAIRDKGQPIVAITHTAPHRDMVHWKYTDKAWDDSNAFYVNSHMSSVLEDHGDVISIWCNGHTHLRNARMIHGVYCIANPRGYPGQNSGWEPVVLEV